MPLSSINTNIKILIASLPLLFIAFYQEWRDYFDLWTNSYIYRHGFLVFAGTLFLLYLRRQRIKQLEISFSRLGLAALVILGFMMLLAHAGNIKLARLLLLPLMIVAWGATIWGKPFVRTIAPPIMLILFAAPFWDDFSPALQWLTVAVDEGALAILGIPATIDEFYITIPSGIFHVAHGCSGIRYLMVGLYLGAFYAVLTDSSAKSTFALILIAGFLALLTNWIRVAWIIAAGHYTNMESSLVDDHEMFGWAVFVAITLIPFFILTHYLDNRRAIFNVKPPNALSHKSKSHYKLTNVLLSAFFPLAAIPSILLIQNYASESYAAEWNPSLPSVDTALWSGPLQYADFWEPQFIAPDIHRSGVYVSDHLSKVQVDLIGYKRQAQGRELIYYENRTYNPEHWTPVQKNTIDISTPGQVLESINELVLKSVNNDQLAVTWYWYDVGGTITTSQTRIQLIAALKEFSGDTRSSVWIFSKMCDELDAETCSERAGSQLESLIKEIYFEHDLN